MLNMRVAELCGVPLTSARMLDVMCDADRTFYKYCDDASPDFIGIEMFYVLHVVPRVYEPLPTTRYSDVPDTMDNCRRHWRAIASAKAAKYHESCCMESALTNLWLKKARVAANDADRQRLERYAQ